MAITIIVVTGNKNKVIGFVSLNVESIRLCFAVPPLHVLPAKKFVFRFIDKADEEKPVVTDYKTTLQEIVQRNPEEAVEYVLVGESGPDHNKTFSVEVHLNSNVIGHGSGRSKKIAEQAAAKEALELMGLKA